MYIAGLQPLDVQIQNGLTFTVTIGKPNLHRLNVNYDNINDDHDVNIELSLHRSIKRSVRTNIEINLI